MAQSVKKTTSKTTGKGKRTPTATGKKPTATGSNASKTSSKAKTPAKSKTPVSPAPTTEAVTPVRREIGAVLCLFFALVALICYFDVDAWLLNAFRNLFAGLFGWGFYITCPVLLLLAAILGFHHGRPVTARVVCASFLPLLFGAFTHLVSYDSGAIYEDGFGYVLSSLWIDGKSLHYHCGGVLGGLLSDGLESGISVYGAASVLLISMFAVLLKTLNVSRSAFTKLISSRPAYTPLDDYAFEDDYQPLDEEFFSKNSKRGDNVDVGPRSRFGLFDIPLEDDGPGPETLDDPLRFRGRRGELYNYEDETFTPAAAATKRKKNTKSARELYDVERETPVTEYVTNTGNTSSSAIYDVEKEETPKRRTKKPKAAPRDTSEVAPLSMDEAAEIAGVTLEPISSATATAVSEDMPGPETSASKPKQLKIDKEAEANRVAAEIAMGEEEEKPEYVFPPLKLLNQGTKGKIDSRSEIDQNQERLSLALQSFNVNAHVVGSTHGPSVTRYDLELDRGVKLNKLTNLAGDIALNLGVSNVRIAPIPDKISTVGVEVPNKHVSTVYLRDIVSSDSFVNAPSKLTFAVGKDIAGNAIVGNISKLPHMLIAGTTGSGKSVFVNSLILSLLYKSTPDEVRMIMIDPKMVELGAYNGMPHLYVPVVTDPKKAAGALQWSVVEMLKRYRLFSEVGVRDLAGYNAIQVRNGEDSMPQVVIIIDELADLMMVASKEVEESICRVAQMGRASGMHLVIATQRPSADVITGLMKANIPSRIAFAVSSSLESRIILDQSGAENLIGNGDMLYAPLGIGKPLRVQGSFVSDDEREQVIEFVKKEAEATYSDEIMAEIERASVDKNSKGKSSSDEEETVEGDYDEMLPQAVDVVLELKQASVSSLQRKLKLGYSRAARIVDQMEELGVVGPYEGSKPRKLLITRQQWQEMQYSTGVAPADTIATEFAEVAADAEFSEAAMPDLSMDDDNEDLF